jgi:type I restriction enzyme M protein
MALLLANGSMSSNTNNEGEIRKAIIEADLVECMIALPGQLFTNTQIPACIWLLTRNKAARNGSRARHGEVLFIDARQCGYMVDRVLRAFDDEKDIRRIADTFHAWKSGPRHSRAACPSPTGSGNPGLYQDIPGFCKSVTLGDIKTHDYVLTPGRYVGAAEQEADGEPFEEKMTRLTMQLMSQFEESARLERAIRENFRGLGYEV